jgi:RimJ/RimL family protein N-acetyltransferase
MLNDSEKTLDLRPTISTSRLVLRPFQIEDAKRVQQLAGHPLVAATTATIPHPYSDGIAESWIGQHLKWFQTGQGVQFAIVSRSLNTLIGCIDLSISAHQSRAELGYWIGVDFWNQGYCTEAAKAVIHFGFTNLNLNKITSRHLSSNPSSGKVMIKAGMRKEGLLRSEFLKNGQFHDLEVYGILRAEN